MPVAPPKPLMYALHRQRKGKKKKNYLSPGNSPPIPSPSPTMTCLTFRVETPTLHHWTFVSQLFCSPDSPPTVGPNGVLLHVRKRIFPSATADPVHPLAHTRNPQHPGPRSPVAQSHSLIPPYPFSICTQPTLARSSRHAGRPPYCIHMQALIPLWPIAARHKVIMCANHQVPRGETPCSTPEEGKGACFPPSRIPYRHR